MSAEQLKKLFEVNHYAFQVNAKEITHDESLIQPTGGGNCLNWVAGHIVANRNFILQLLGEEPIWSQERAELYKRGSAPILDGSEALPLSSILGDFSRSQDGVRKGLERITDEALSERRKDETVRESLHFLQFHEAYHIGQMGLLRRMAGREGAIP